MSSSAHRFAELDPLLDAALDRPTAEREPWIRAIGRDHPSLEARLLKLVSLARSEGALVPAGALRGPAWDELARELAAPSLQPGQRIGPYEIRELAAVGGMGEVYRAWDSVLGRDVAVKALPRHRAADAQVHESRLEREARLLAALNHPNIAAIHGLERAGGALYLILEWVPGETLADRLARGRLLLPEALEVAGQVAFALQEAHRHGIVHRDLKPSNVKRDADGRVKVLDFGIAKRTDAPDGPEKTAAGRVIGTPAYMSPEQASGDAIDTRADIWAFGCLLYEMLTGERAFRGISPTEVLAAVLRDEVDWSRLPAGLPPNVRRLLRRCLQRDVRERLQDIGDARLELTELDTEEHAAADMGHARRRLPAVAAGLVLAVVGAGLGLSARRPPATDAVIARLGLDLPASLTVAGDFASPFAMAPDGSRVVVLAEGPDGRQRLYVRALDEPDATPLAGTEGAWQPFFSADGRSVAFFAERKLKTVPIDGGPVLTVAEVGRNPRGGSWGEDGTLVVSSSSRASLDRVAGSILQPLTHLDLARGERSHRWPQVLPGARWVLFTSSVGETTFDEARLEVVSLVSGERRVVIEGAGQGRYAAGRLFFSRSGRTHAVAFDPRTAQVSGKPVVALEGVRYDPRSGATDLALADSGTYVYRPAPPTSPESFLAWMDADGRLSRIDQTPRRFREPRLSPDGRRIAVRVGSDAESELWVFETVGATSRRVAHPRPLHRPTWTRDGRGLTVSSETNGTWTVLTFPVSGGGAPTVVYQSRHRVYANAWSADGRTLVIQERRPGTGWDLRALEVGADGRGAGARDLAADVFDERNAALSPDGRHIAYEADEPDGIAEIYVAPLDGGRTPRRLTVSSGRWPRWGASGELYWWLPAGRPPEIEHVAEGLHRIDWRGPDVPRDRPIWGETPSRDLLRRVVVTAYASFDVDVTAGRTRFLVLETATSTAEPSSSRPLIALMRPSL